MKKLNLNQQVRIIYTNYKGIKKPRTIIPKRIEFKSTEYHKEEQWILDAYDLDKKADRGFAVKDIEGWEPLK